MHMLIKILLLIFILNILMILVYKMSKDSKFSVTQDKEQNRSCWMNENESLILQLADDLFHLIIWALTCRIKAETLPRCAVGDLQGHWREAAWRNKRVCAALRLTSHELHRARRHPLDRPQVLWGGGAGGARPLQGNQRVSVEQGEGKIQNT